MKTRFAVPDHLKEPYDIETFKALKAADATSVLVGEVSTAIAAAFREKTPANLIPSWKVLQDQYKELSEPTLSSNLNGQALGFLTELFVCRSEEVGKETAKKKRLTSAAIDWAENVGRITVAE